MKRAAWALLFCLGCGSAAVEAPHIEPPRPLVPETVCAGEGEHFRLSAFVVFAGPQLLASERARLDAIDRSGTRGADLWMLRALVDGVARRLLPLQLEAQSNPALAERFRRLPPVSSRDTAARAHELALEAVSDTSTILVPWLVTSTLQLLATNPSRVNPDSDPTEADCRPREDAQSNAARILRHVLRSGAPREAVVDAALATHAAMADAARAELAAAREAASATPRDRAATAMEALFAACRDGRPRDAAQHVAYRGRDRSRRWRSSASMDRPNEARQIEGICARIAGLLSQSTGHQKVGYQSEAQSEGVWHVWEVRFDTASGPRTQLFAFLEVDGRFLLGDID